MKVLVINGSPKGDMSITLQTAKYMEKCNPEGDFVFLPAASRLAAYEKDFSEAIEAMEAADLILFSYPVYTFLVPAQLHRFVELMKENAASGKLHLQGKCVTQVTTSKHFYDVSAHAFIEENMRDLGMTVLQGLSADMEDLTKEEGQKAARDSFFYWKWLMSGSSADALAVKNVVNASDSPKRNEGELTISKDAISKDTIVLVTDCKEDDAELAKMITAFQEYDQKQFGRPVVIVNLNQVEIRGGCLGCLRCVTDGICIYKDRFDVYLREVVQGGAGIVYAFRIKDHSMGSLFKKYDDRQFCNGHRTVTMGSPIGYLVAGDLSKENNLSMVLKARAQVGGNFDAGAVDSANKNAEELEESIAFLAKNIEFNLTSGYHPPAMFYGVGGMRIFRDLIYQMQGIMKMDHKFFKEHGQYDFPQKKKGTILASYLLGMMATKKMRDKMGKKFEEGMLSSYKKISE